MGKLNNDFNELLLRQLQLMRSCNDSIERNIKIQCVLLVLLGVVGLGFFAIMLMLIVNG